MLKKKSIVLSDTKNNTQRKAVLTIQEDLGNVKGTLRLYNFPSELDGISSLGLYADKKVYKAGLTLKSYMLYEFFIDLKNIPQNFSVAVVNFQNAVATPILYGASDGSDENIFGNIISDLSGQKLSAKNTEQVLDAYGVDFDEEEKKEIEKEIDDALCQGNCSDCVYKKYFFETQTPKQEDELVKVSQQKTFFEEEKAFSLKEEEKPKQEVELPKEKIETKDVIFFDRLKPQIDKLFEKNPIENNLQSLIPSSKWIKVEYEDDGDFYVFGLLYDEDDNVRYVCYGVPAVFDEEPPKELAGYPIWFPLDREKGFGYWLTYQDATTGEPVKAIID